MDIDESRRNEFTSNLVDMVSTAREERVMDRSYNHIYLLGWLGCARDEYKLSLRLSAGGETIDTVTEGQVRGDCGECENLFSHDRSQNE